MSDKEQEYKGFEIKHKPLEKATVSHESQERSDYKLCQE